MKNLLIILALILIPLSVCSQQSEQSNPLPLAKFNNNVKIPLTSKERSQIIEVYGEYADKYVFNNDQRLRSIKHILRNRVEIKLITDKNNRKACTKLSEVTILDGFVSELERDETFNPNNFNPLKYNFEFHSRAAAMYQVDGTNYYITIKSQYQ
ncbi:hypothetical protein [Winogradskyella bathintestinalis]|uniref:Lipoprotein n=1 Tax=Winogradskyella bathintestinalis TaxID=3035208 RepID=A0ABT7ZYB4_9FLAO|nr:hypothetical protein [Winogradskyella bathintestinalis]MDN3493979.1 hypothetical protein [Winogradskyella bathintestinalis]